MINDKKFGVNIMQNIDFTDRMRHEMLLSEQTLEKELKKEEGNKSGQLDASAHEMSTELKSIVSLCQDMYLNRDENTSAINLSRVDEKVAYNLMFSDKVIFISIMEGDNEIEFIFDFDTGKIKKGKSVILNTKPFVKVFNEILKDSLSNKNEILNISWEEK